MKVNNPETILCTLHLTTQASMISIIFNLLPPFR